MKKAFTMVELIFVIVIIGVLTSVAIPKLSGVTDGAKKSAEIATISAVVTALESANGEWSINESDFTWGNHQNSNKLNTKTGYPDILGSDNKNPFNYVVKNSGKFEKIISNFDSNISIFKGPASNSNGVKFTDERADNDIPNKPDKNDFWLYAFGVNDCNVTCTNCIPKNVYYGDFVLIDVTEKDITLPNNITCN